MGRRRIDLTGQRFGSWTVLGFSHTSDKGGHAVWLCRCDCGTEMPVAARTLRNGTSTRCQACAHASRRKDYTGTRFGKWLVLARADATEQGLAQWLCRCECGRKKVLLYVNLIRGHSTQCRSCASRNRTSN